MEHIRKRRKRPCRICQKWFAPNPRLDDRQQTCGDEECKRKWHAKKCAEWNRKNRTYFRAIYLSGKLQSNNDTSKADDRHPPSFRSGKICSVTNPQPRFVPQLPRDVIQEVIGAQPLVIMEYVAQLLFSSFKDVIRTQPIEMQRKSKRIPQDASLRGDGLGRGS